MEGADFSEADFTEAFLVGVRFREAVLRRANFTRAHVLECDFEGMDLTGVSFSAADLSRSLFTGSVMRGGDLNGAMLRDAWLAEVEWEGVDLRGVDFRDGRRFIWRSGLVQSTIASEGTRTGFYTDDYNEHDYKAPEEIRKANLCGCDLQGANVERKDFYLVDLRGGEVHWRSSGSTLCAAGRS